MTFGQFHERRHKYGAVPVEVDGIRFASKREANRYGELLMLARAREIWDLTLQPNFDLHVRYAPILPVDQPAAGRRCSRPSSASGHTGPISRTRRKAARSSRIARAFVHPLYRWKKKHVEA